MPMIDKVCAACRNWFDVDDMTGAELVHRGTYTVQNGRINAGFLVPGQWFRVRGSRFNDGVHQLGADDLRDETFAGGVWEMSPPPDFLNLVAEINAWNDRYGDDMRKPFQSESVSGVYSYTKGTGASWQSAFADRLNRYRRL